MADTTSSIPNESLVTSFNEKLIFINPETYIDEQAAKALEDIITKKAVSLNLDNNLASLSYGEKQNTVSFFENVIDQPPHMSNDHIRMRNFIIDWYSAHKSLITKSKKILDLNLLSSDELNELILSFGFPYPRNIISRSHKIQFLSSLIDLYKKKGTAFTLWNILTLYGLNEVIISEWWVRHDERKHPSVFVRSKPMYPVKFRGNENLVIEKDLEDFTTDPYWQQSKYEIIQAFNNKDNKISLPSITPFISIQAYTNVSRLELPISIIQRKIYETLRYWITYTLIPVNLEDLGITEVLQEIPILNAPPTTFPTNDEIEDYPTKNILYAVGPNPEGEFIGHERQIAKRIDDGEGNISWVFDPDKAVGLAFIARKDSDVAANKLIKYDYPDDGTGRVVWQVYSPSKNALIQESVSYLFDRPRTSLVFNGNEWQRLDKIIPTDLLNETINKDIFRDVSLNGFTSLYSPLEVALAISYLHNGDFLTLNKEPFPGSTAIATELLNRFDEISGDDVLISLEEAQSIFPDLTDAQFQAIDILGNGSDDKLSRQELLHAIRYTKHIFYNGAYSPLDKLPYDNVDDSYLQTDPYKEVKEEYKKLYDEDLMADGDAHSLSFRHISPEFKYKRNNLNTDPKALRDEKLIAWESKYTKTCVPDVDHELCPQQNPKYFLKALNPDFYDEIEARKLIDSDLLLEEIMSDFESYMMQEMSILTTPFTYLQTGGTFLNKKLKPVINFFKPLRVRLLEFLTSMRINDPLMDSCIPGDQDGFGMTLNQTFHDKPFPVDFSVEKSFIKAYVRTLDMDIFDKNVIITPPEQGTAEISYDPDIEKFVIKVTVNFDAFYYALYNGTIVTPSTIINSGSVNTIDGVVTIYLTRAQFLTNQTPSNTIRLDIYLQSDQGIGGVTGDIGVECAQIYTRVPVFDNGLPMDEICIFGTHMYFGDIFSAPYGSLNTGKVQKPGSTEPGDYIAYIDRNTFDVNMKDDLFVRITDKDSPNGTTTINEYEISMDDEEAVGAVAEVHLLGSTCEGDTPLDLLLLSPIYDGDEFYAVCRVSYDTTSTDLNFDITHNTRCSTYTLIGVDGTGGTTFLELQLPGPEITTPISIQVNRSTYYSSLTTYPNVYIVMGILNDLDNILYIAAKVNNAVDFVSAQYP